MVGGERGDEGIEGEEIGGKRGGEEGGEGGEWEAEGGVERNEGGGELRGGGEEAGGDEMGVDLVGSLEVVGVRTVMEVGDEGGDGECRGFVYHLEECIV